MTEPVRRQAPAKLNLFLHVTGRRADGYHLLDSLVAFVDLGDVVTVRSAAALELTVDGPFAAALAGGGDNLMLRAARALDAQRGAALALTKNLPVASGIGGGSADAAATLLALRQLWELDIADEALAAIGLKLGADVPACLRSTPAWLGGIGEDLQPAPALPPTHVVLVNPGVPLATPEVFRAYAAAAQTFSPPGRAPAMTFVSAFVLASYLKSCRNDLEPVARFACPPVDEALRALASQPACLLARMSGSGATCFGLFASALAAGRAVAQIRQAEPGWWMEGTTLLLP